MNDKFVDSAISKLLELKGDPLLNLSLSHQIDDFLSGLRFLQLYVQCLAKWNEALQGKKNRHLGSAKNFHIKATLGGAIKGLYTTGITALTTQDFQDWDNLASNLLQGIQKSKPKIGEDCLYFLKCFFQCRFSSFELQKFFLNLFDSLDYIVRMKSEEAVDIKIQIQGIKEKLHLFKQIFELTRKIRSNNKDLKDFNLRIQAWTYNAACLSLLYWVRDENEEEILPRMRIFLSTQEVTRMFLAVLMHLWSLSHNRLLMDEGVPKFVDFLLEILQHFPPKDGIQNLQSKLIFLTTFLVHPPMADEYRWDAKSIAIEVQSLICSLDANQVKGGTAEDFQEKVNTVNVKVSELYARIFLDSSSFDFPRINVLGFIDSVIDNLREISLHMPSIHHFEKMLEEDMLSLRYFLKDILSNHMNLDKDLCIRIINVVYRVEIVVNMLSYLNDCIWYDMKIFYSDVREEIDLIKSEVTEIHYVQRHDTTILHGEWGRERNLSLVHLGHDHVSRIDDEVVVGFKDEISDIVKELTSGPREVEIVSIVGMARQGKTTVAKMVYDAPDVRQHFDVRAWCTVSRTYQIKNLLLSFSPHDPANFEIRDDDVLAGRLWKRLKYRRYLIVLDDVWDTMADLKYVFPNDENGSRILITTRINDLKLQIRHDCRPHILRQLSCKESWELLKKKVFHNGPCPSELEEVGNRIAKLCDGQPLAVVVIAGLLSRDVNNLDWWIHISENLDSIIAGPESRSVAELISYRHLPELLKPCFLYFGGFQQDKVIRARRLIQLWVAEGFIEKSDTVSLERKAEEYLMDLASRTLVAVTERSSNGGIKACRISSIFYEFCKEKSKEEKFLQVESGNDVCMGAIYKNYRICIQSGGDGFFASNPSGPCVHSLLFIPDHTCLNKGDLFSICNFILLQVLDLEDMELSGYFPEEVIRLVLLRYLAIWCPYGILSVPPSVANLRNLETFRVKREVRFGDEICLPSTLWTMKRLRHVDVGGFIAPVSGDCLPDEATLALDNIQTFSAPSLSYGEDAAKLLRRLRGVGKLRCQFNDSCADPYRFPALGVLSKLESLNVRYTGSLFYPCAFNFPSTLKKLTLAEFKLPWREMSTIAENLPNLEVLKLLKDAFDGEEWDMKAVKFSKLKFLKLCELNLVKWTSDEEFVEFPCLEQLIVENCDELEEIPLVFGDVPTLKKIQVRWCKSTVANSARKIKRKKLDNPYVYVDFDACIRDTYY